jgi:hypothetical protein
MNHTIHRSEEPLDPRRRGFEGVRFVDDGAAGHAPEVVGTGGGDAAIVVGSEWYVAPSWSAANGSSSFFRLPNMAAK